MTFSSGFRICNNHWDHVHAAFMFLNPDCGTNNPFLTRGWWNIEPGQCAILYVGDLHEVADFWYWHAHSDDGWVWGSPFIMTVKRPYRAFNLCLDDPATSEAEISIGFGRYSAGNHRVGYDACTITLNPPRRR